MTDNWVCAKCGRKFSRKWSGKRHLVNVENGASSFVTLEHYELGIRIGVLVPTFKRPVIASKQDADITTLFQKTSKRNLLTTWQKWQFRTSNPEC